MFAPCWIKLPELRSFEEIYFIVASPDKGSIRIVRDSWKSILDVFRIASNGLLVDKLPILISFEQVGGPGVSPGEPCLDITGQPRPVSGNLPRISSCNCLGGQLPVVVISKGSRIIIKDC